MTARRKEEAFHRHAITTGNNCQQIDKKINLKKELKAATTGLILQATKATDY